MTSSAGEPHDHRTDGEHEQDSISQSAMITIGMISWTTLLTQGIGVRVRVSKQEGEDGAGDGHVYDRPTADEIQRR